MVRREVQMTYQVLHVVPSSIYNPRHLYLGVTKDIRGRTEYFETRGIPVQELRLEKRNDQVLLEQLQTIKMEQFSAVMIEYSHFPRSIRYLKELLPEVKILVRGINAEFLQQWHYTLGCIKNTKMYRKSWNYFILSFRRLWQDYQSVVLADRVLSICSWERDRYWQRLSRSGRVLNVPYFLPKYFEIPRPANLVKKNQCVCLMSTTSGTLPFLLDAVTTFNEMIAANHEHLPEWKFCVTGDTLDDQLQFHPRLQQTGFLPSPLALLQESKAVALLSDYGYGFKTKILDAIECGCYVLITAQLFSRLPEAVKPYCFIVNPQQPESFVDALKQCEVPLGEINVNSKLKTEAFQALDLALFDRHLPSSRYVDSIEILPNS